MTVIVAIPRRWVKGFTLRGSLKNQSGRQDSNLRPDAPKARVLLICKRQAGAGISPQKAV